MSAAFHHLVNVVAKLRGPDGCPWDRQQTHDSLKPFLLEEAYEVSDAIENNNPALLREELGDLLLQILLHAQLESEAQTFTIDQVMTTLTDKLVRRHPHVFGPNTQGTSALSSDQVTQQWERIKQEEKKQTSSSQESILSGIPRTLPALLRAWTIQSRASRVGFDWPTIQGVVDKLQEEVEELREAAISAEQSGTPLQGDKTTEAPQEALEREFGDVLFTIANLARFLHINPEEALRKSTNRFITRFHHLETRAAEKQKALNTVSDTEWDAWWEEAKRQEQTNSSTGTLNPID
ncbi:MAG: nucleoside triphosphate pyrophosphohydrolase [Nitrospirales bacterium]|nr:nucleoside triphosphate pyrophosphohydrolase [Nitrospirales bacterium]